MTEKRRICSSSFQYPSSSSSISSFIASTESTNSSSLSIFCLRFQRSWTALSSNRPVCLKSACYSAYHSSRQRVWAFSKGRASKSSFERRFTSTMAVGRKLLAMLLRRPSDSIGLSLNIFNSPKQRRKGVCWSAGTNESSLVSWCCPIAFDVGLQIKWPIFTGFIFCQLRHCTLASHRQQRLQS
jgi:hypothetical protein